MKKFHFVFLILIFINFLLSSNIKPDITVAADGSADFNTIQLAVDAVPENNTKRVIIYIKAGIYNEKIFISKDNISLIGDSPDNTCIELPILRSQWREDHSDDWGAAVVNIRANDFILKNVTVHNTYGDLYGDHGHQFAIRLMKGTRIIFDNCKFIAGGGDTVSLWDKENGMYYHRKCFFQGYVDFVCPRGWCYITDSNFFECGQTAALWHDGQKNETQKFVIKNSFFNGILGFKLGRRHYDAQFYILNCTFSENMADQPIYRVTYPDNPSRNAPNLWGDRYYFHSCHKENGDYTWYSDNVGFIKSVPGMDGITAAWTFDFKWDPESITPPGITKWSIRNNIVELYFKENITVRGEPYLRMKSGLVVRYKRNIAGNGLLFFCEQTLPWDDSPVAFFFKDAAIFSSEASLKLRKADININTD